jgi:putative hydrolase of the HAD superfamily
LFDEFSTTRCWELYPDAVEVLDELRSQGVKLGVLSNFDFRLGPLLQNLGLTPHLDCVVASYQTGYEKPNPEMFLAAELALPGSSYTLVGDHWEDDVMGALAAGWNAVWVDRAGAMSSEPSPLATHSVPRCKTLAEVLAYA